MVKKLIRPITGFFTRGNTNNRLLLHYYFAIIFGIAALALILDFLFYPWFKSQESQRAYDALYQLANASAQTLIEAGDTDQHTIGPYSLRILPAQSVHRENTAARNQPYTLASNDAGEQFLNWPSETGEHWIQFGPLPPLDLHPDWPTWIFYGSLFVLVSLWLRPLLKDLDRISQAVNAFRNDYRAPLPQLKNSSNLKPLANNIAGMADKIRRLIDTQKDLSNVLSHEMRTPLSRVKFSLALLRGDSHLSEQQQQELAGIDQDINELQRLTQAMLEFAKLDHPDMAIEPQTIPAWQWLNSYVEKQSRLSEAVTISAHMQPMDTKYEITADPYWLELAVSNLVTNALRYAQHDITLELNATPTGFELSVADDGPGIEPSQTEQVIKPFYQADQANSKGFGLGLALVHRIAQLHGGGIQVGQSPLGGACISVLVNY